MSFVGRTGALLQLLPCYACLDDHWNGPHSAPVHVHGFISPCSPYELSSLLQAASEQEQVAQDFALLCLEAGSPDVLAILKEMMQPSEENHILEGALNGQAERPRALLTKLFPGRIKTVPEVAIFWVIVFGRLYTETRKTFWMTEALCANAP